MSLFRLRGHTCKFNPLLREQTLVAILQPTNMGMHFSQDTEANRTRIDINFNHLVFNVSPASIYIIYNSYNTFMTEFFSSETAEEEKREREEEEGGCMENLWATSTFQEDELWYPKLDNALEVLGRGMVSGFSHPLSSIQSTVQLEVAYYNAKLALWELVIEPVGYISHTGHTHYSRWSLDLRYLPPATSSCLQVCPPGTR